MYLLALQRLFDIVNKILEYGKGQNRVEAMLEQGDFSGAVSRIMVPSTLPASAPFEGNHDDRK